jgi:hypothetical protein
LLHLPRGDTALIESVLFTRAQSDKVHGLGETFSRELWGLWTVARRDVFLLRILGAKNSHFLGKKIIESNLKKKKPGELCKNNCAGIGCDNGVEDVTELSHT